MTASIGMQVTGGFYQTRNRYERPDHTYPEWENPPIHYVTDDRIAWHRQYLPINDPVRISIAGSRSQLTLAPPPAYRSMTQPIPTVSAVHRVSLSGNTTQVLTAATYGVISQPIPSISGAHRYTTHFTRTQVLTEPTYSSMLQPIATATPVHRISSSGNTTQELTSTEYGVMSQPIPIQSQIRHGDAGTRIQLNVAAPSAYADLVTTNAIPI